MSNKFGYDFRCEQSYQLLKDVVREADEEEDLKQFIDEVKKGPAFSVVTDVKIEEVKDSRKYSIFDIKF